MKLGTITQDDSIERETVNHSEDKAAGRIEGDGNEQRLANSDRSREEKGILPKNATKRA